MADFRCKIGKTLAIIEMISGNMNKQLMVSDY